MESTQYQYQPLLKKNEIRLLYLDAGSPHDALSGRLQHVRMDGWTSFDAVSYVWGQHAKTETLNTPEGCIPITRSLFRALRRVRMRAQLRHLSHKELLEAMLHDQKPSWHRRNPYWDEDDTRDLEELGIRVDRVVDGYISHKEVDDVRHFTRRTQKPLVIWADAICIDQASKSEKVHQVSLMGNIFASASIVWVYLGEVFRQPEHLVEQAREYRGFASACRDLLDNPWFHRAWTVQEYVLAKRVKAICGPRSFDMERLAELIHTRFVYGDVAKHANDMLELREHRSSGRKLSFQEILKLPSLATRRCSLPQDRLWAFLPLAADRDKPDYIPDYDTSLEDLQLKLAVGFVTTSTGIKPELLVRAVAQDTFGRRIGRRTSSGLYRRSRLPTWIPDIFGPIHLARMVNFNEIPTHAMEAKVDVTGGVLTLPGTMVLVVEKPVYNHLYHRSRVNHSPLWCPSLMDLVRELSWYVLSLGDDPRYWKTVYWSIGKLPIRSKEGAQELADLMQLVGAGLKSSGCDGFDCPDAEGQPFRHIIDKLTEQAPRLQAVVSSATTAASTETRMFEGVDTRVALTGWLVSAHAFLDALKNWQLYRTASHQVILGPPGAVNGDKICTFRKFRQGFLLRPEKQGSSRHHLVGCVFSPDLVDRGTLRQMAATDQDIALV